MAFLTTGGSLVTSDSIVDGSVLNADVNAAAAIAQSKIAGTPNDNTGIVAVERTVGATHALTTVANQRVVVIATGNLGISSSTLLDTVNLKYNGVTKDSIEVGESGGNGNNRDAFCLTYTEVPGAATANITVDADFYSPTNVKILVMKFK